MSIEILLFILFIAFEVFEIVWQKSPTLHIMLKRIYAFYRKSPYLLYLMHPSYILGILLFVLTQYNLWILVILLIKSIDIVFKVWLIHKYFIRHELSDEMRMMLYAPLHPVMFLMGLMLYPYLLYLALF